MEEENNLLRVENAKLMQRLRLLEAEFAKLKDESQLSGLREQLPRIKILPGIHSLEASSSESSDSRSEGPKLVPVFRATEMKQEGFKIPEEISNPPVKSAQVTVVTVGRKKCPHCDHRANDASDLSRHINDRHILQKMYQCPVCGECSKQSTNLKARSLRAHRVDLSFMPSALTKMYYITKDKQKVRVTVGVIIDPYNIQPTLLSEEELKKRAEAFNPVMRN